MRDSFFRSFTLLLFILVFASCSKEEESVPRDLFPSKLEHPRILLLEGEEAQIRELIERDKIWKNIHFEILSQARDILGKPELERNMVGRRLLATSRELLRRIFFLAYDYRMTGDERFLQKAEREMLSVARFSDWNPSHFLDVAEMTAGMAIGYDWLYEDLSAESREAIMYAIVDKGLVQSKKSEYNSWLRRDNNWNQVCNAGMLLGALAIQDDFPDLANEIVERSFESIPLPMEAYMPDGGYPEGYGYWGYGTTYNVLFLSAVEKALGTDRGLSSLSGFVDSGHFLKHMITPSGSCFNWGDNSIYTNLKPAMFWMAQKANDPSMLWSEKQFLEIEDYSKLKWIGVLPAMLVWAKDNAITDIQEPKERFWIGQGSSPVAMMRSSWSDPDAIFLGFKAGSPSVNHGHMDIGSFVMEADGKRWAADLGKQNYESLESLGMRIFGKGQDAERWTIFRMSTYSHNVLIVDGEQQRVEGYAKIEKHSDEDEFSYAVSDISAVYDTQLKKAIRGVGLVDNSYTIIRDEIETLDRSTNIRWNMVTYADAELGDKQAILTNGDEVLHMYVSGPDNVQMRTWSTQPTNNYDAENPGTVMVGFECVAEANSNISFEVILVPEKAKTTADFLYKGLAEW